MKLKEVIRNTGIVLPEAYQDIDVKGVTSDSRQVYDDFIFVVIKGLNLDGHAFINEAIQKGANVIIVQEENNPFSSEEGGVIYIRIAADIRRLLAQISANFYDNPSHNLKVVGITGTNGKTTVTYLIESILNHAHFCPAVIGTINYRFRDKVLKSLHTTPDPVELQCLLAQMYKQGVDYVVTEVSSHALEQERVVGVNFTAGIFTNISPEHLDYHQDMNAYFTAKTKLFKIVSKYGVVILNYDDSYTSELAKLTEARVILYGLNSSAHIWADGLKFNDTGTEFFLNIGSAFKKNFSQKYSRVRIKTSLLGEYNVYNVLAAAAFALTEGIDIPVITEALEIFSGVPGRLERVLIGQDFSVFVDYAHTEDSIRKVIGVLRSICNGRLYVVFGCGGARDKTKRPKMGKAASELADMAIITTDNPRNEKPEKIIEDIVAGIDNKTNFKIVIDRKDAIKEVLSLAKKDDIILIAGKGHENYQIFEDRIINFDDREAVRECLESQK